jgi:hypothetical protein
MMESEMSRIAIPAFAALAIALSPSLALADGQGAVTGAAGGAVTGAVVGGPVGAAVGGAAGAVIGGAATDKPNTVVVQPGAAPCQSTTVQQDDAVGSTTVHRTDCP